MALSHVKGEVTIDVFGNGVNEISGMTCRGDKIASKCSTRLLFIHRWAAILVERRSNGFVPTEARRNR